MHPVSLLSVLELSLTYTVTSAWDTHYTSYLQFVHYLALTTGGYVLNNEPGVSHSSRREICQLFHLVVEACDDSTQPLTTAQDPRSGCMQRSLQPLVGNTGGLHSRSISSPDAPADLHSEYLNHLSWRSVWSSSISTPTGSDVPNPCISASLSLFALLRRPVK